MSELSADSLTIVLCDSWYMKKNLLKVRKEYSNLRFIGNVRSDTKIYDLPGKRTGERGRPRIFGKVLSLYEDFCLSEQPIGDYYVAKRQVKTRLFGDEVVEAYVTSKERDGSTRRLFLSTLLSHEAQLLYTMIWGATKDNSKREQDMPYTPLLLYAMRWNIEVSYYEQKTFWCFCSYMLRGEHGIEMTVNLINIAYCAMRILRYQNSLFAEYQKDSLQESRFAMSEQINLEIFFATFVNRFETVINSGAFFNALKTMVFKMRENSQNL